MDDNTFATHQQMPPEVSRAVFGTSPSDETEPPEPPKEINPWQVKMGADWNDDDAEERKIASMHDPVRRFFFPQEYIDTTPAAALTYNGDNATLVKRFTGDTRRENLKAFVRRALAGGETAEDLAAFAEARDQRTANLIRELAQELENE